MKNNIFIEFVKEYDSELKRLRSLDHTYKCFILPEFSNIFDFIGAKKCKEIGLKKLYDSVKNNIQTSIIYNNLLTELEFVEMFVYFLRFAEKCFMYTNSDIKRIYSEIDTNSKKSILYYKTQNYKVKISFEESKIKSPQISNFPFNLLEEEPNNIVFINIEIARLFGKQMQNTFKFIFGENIKFNDSSDRTLLEFVMKDILEEICKVLDEVVNIITMHNYPILFEDWQYFIDHGIYMKKKRGIK